MHTIAIYGLQAAMGVLGIAAGAAKLAGTDLMVDAFDMLGLGTSFRLLAGSAEVLGGICLLLPRAGVLGAALLASVVVGTTGITIGQVASQLRNPDSGLVQTHQAMQSGKFNATRPLVKNTDGYNI